MTTNPYIQLDNISKSYFATREVKHQKCFTLENISFSLKSGETIGIIGKNGSGKSTLLQIIAGIVRPDKGKIIYSGRLSSILDIGSGFHPELTGRENLNFFRVNLQKSKHSSTAQKIIEFSELDYYIDQPVKYYSSGMYLRLAMSIMLHDDVDIFCLDEVVSVGDKFFSAKIFEMLKNKVQNGCILILSSHDMGAVLNLCEKAIFLKNGSMVNIGSSFNVVREYYNNAEESFFLNLKEEKSNKYFKFSSPYITYKGEKSYEILFGEKLDINLPFKINEGVLSLSFAISIKDIQGNVVLFTTNYFNKNHKSFIFEGAGEHLCICSLPSILNIGMYFIHVRVLDYNEYTIAEYSSNAPFSVICKDKNISLALLKTPYKITSEAQWEITEANIL